MTIAENEARLLHLLSQWQDDECLHLLDRARDEALELLHGAHQRARRHLKAAVAAERARAETRLRAGRAELDTRRRAHRRDLALALLAAARERLPVALQGRWTDPTLRAAWIRGILSRSQELLPPGPWRLYHPPDWGAADEAVLDQTLGQHPGESVERLPDQGLDAGLVVACRGIRLDGSAAGLLADRDTLEARLLALLKLEETP